MSRDSSSPAHLLLAISFSHYNEKARWAFAYYGVSFTQQQLLPAFHISPVKRMVNLLDADKQKTDGKRTRTSTPLLVVGDPTSSSRKLYHDSHDILVYLSETYATPERPSLYTSCGEDKAEEIMALEKHYDKTLGVDTRLFAYYNLLVLGKWRGMIPFAMLGFRNGFGVLHSLVWFFMSSFVGRLLPRVLKVTPEAYEKATQRCRDEFARASEKSDWLLVLEHSEYLSGPNLSASDITFASLAYPVVGVSHEEGFSAISVSSSARTAESGALRKELRATKAGQHVLRLFAEKKALDAEIVVQDKKSFFGLW